VHERREAPDRPVSRGAVSIEGAAVGGDATQLGVEITNDPLANAGLPGR
jgi:hypothetical protein